ncbi:MrcB family domain-containing protein [Streptomyces zingiberis]|uniref:DUF3578 domain-containing protein n=1 Tax=Streptomyces zingiberis TaxID=2053010 RepID=A0ABX1C1U4_9ACTN|nr:DUF3578 domain-containing protein [Streptomyces zingiberis]NJQ01872.1 DUF3578 domain-containing protein [Streptomyces zingiberis]
MDLHDLFVQIAATYDRKDGTRTGVFAQDLLRSVHKELRAVVPAGLEIAGYGGQGYANTTPWIGVFDPDVTRNPKEDLYLAYIFSTDLESVTLTLQQGVTQLTDELNKGEELRARLERNAQRLRKKLPQEIIKSWHDEPQFKERRWRARAYESANVAARRYLIKSLPPEVTLRRDLWSMAEILQYAASVEKSLWYWDPPTDGTQLEVEYQGGHKEIVDQQGDLLENFRPKNDGDYIAKVSEKHQTRERRHETLISEFGPYIAERGFTPITEGMHPRDLVLRRGSSEWLVEAKVVRRGNPTKAAREALAQLFEYRHFLYGEAGSKPHLLALFTEDVGVFAEYLETHGVASVWKTLDGWSGSPMAVHEGIVTQPLPSQPTSG